MSTAQGLAGIGVDSVVVEVGSGGLIMPASVQRQAAAVAPGQPRTDATLRLEQNPNNVYGRPRIGCTCSE